MEYRGGDAPVWTGLLVCPSCNFAPQPYYSARHIPFDPKPVLNARPERVEAVISALLTEDGDDITTEAGEVLGF